MVGIDADHGVEVALCKGESVGIGVEGNDSPVQPQLAESPVIFCCRDPEIHRKDLHVKLLRQPDRGQSPAAAQVQYPHARPECAAVQQLLQNPHRVGAHHVFRQKSGGEGMAFHGNLRFCHPAASGSFKKGSRCIRPISCPEMRTVSSDQAMRERGM